MKKLLYFILAVIFIVGGAAVALVTLVNPNQFKPMLVEQVKKSTGQELIITGDLSWRFFPSLGINVGETILKNSSEFSDPNLLALKSMELSVSVLPLFSKQLEVGNVELLGANLSLHTLSDGRSNLDNLTNQDDSSKEQQNKSATQDIKSKETTEIKNTKNSKWKIMIAGISVVDGQLKIQDDRTNMSTEIKQVNFNLSHFLPGEWSQVSFSAQGKQNLSTFSISSTGEINIAEDLKSATFKNIEIEGSFNDNQGFNLENFRATADLINPNSPATIAMKVNGISNDLTFDIKTQTNIQLDENKNDVNLKQLIINGHVAGDSVPNGKTALNLSTNVQYQLDKQLAQLSSLIINIDDTTITGSGSFQSKSRPRVTLNLASEKIDLNKLLAISASPETTGKSHSPDNQGNKPTNTTVVKSNQEPDLAGLKLVDLDLKLQIKQLIANHLKLNNIQSHMTLDQGIAKLENLSANLYGGKVVTKATLNSNGKLATYTVNKQLIGVNARPLLIDLADFDHLAGTMNISAALSGQGLSEARLKGDSKGKVEAKFTDGAIYGVNIPQMIRHAQAKLKGKTLPPEEKSEKKTDFSALTANVTLNKGIATVSNINMASPLLRVKGSGTTNIVDETVNMVMKTSIVGTLEGQEGRDLNELKGITIPIKVTNTWQNPKYSIVIDDLLKKKVEKEAERGLKKIIGDKSKDEKVNKAVESLFNKLF
ncbi:AsmA family protein [Vibrio sp. SS-MA-C1-2]|uniref:AsmA family protein n=1 Tax=Vibrio sp. SS-MA-C1-2 TaxID=2908646 RepID=UPI001F229034|nr:AsmA family protein [Vibrio sp. SS-MA-C1-2]UJF19907.1 AsmA family protein [Vibrio sp. SS-MA-C1-2]